jgi:hypothetical protein
MQSTVVLSNGRADDQGGPMSEFSSDHEYFFLFDWPVNYICVSWVGDGAGNNTEMAIIEDIVSYQITTSDYGFVLRVKGCHIVVTNFPNSRFRTLFCPVNGCFSGSG